MVCKPVRLSSLLHVHTDVRLDNITCTLRDLSTDLSDQRIRQRRSTCYFQSRCFIPGSLQRTQQLNIKFNFNLSGRAGRQTESRRMRFLYVAIPNLKEPVCMKHNLLVVGLRAPVVDVFVPNVKVKVPSVTLHLQKTTFCPAHQLC